MRRTGLKKYEYADVEHFTSKAGLRFRKIMNKSWHIFLRLGTTRKIHIVDYPQLQKGKNYIFACNHSFDEDVISTLYAIFYVADGDKSTVNNVKYLSDVQLWVQWSDETAWNGDYYTDREGAFPYGILINRDQTIRVKLKDSFGNGNEYECELTLYVPKIGEANPKSIIFVKKNGSCNVVSTDEYFMW